MSRNTFIRCCSLILLSCLWLSGCIKPRGVRSAGLESRTPMFMNHESETSGAEKSLKVLFLGNSITSHAPAPKLGWEGDWGMAASAREKDYVHIIGQALADKHGESPRVMIKNIVDFERSYTRYQPARSLKSELRFKPDIIILAIGENVLAPQRQEAKLAFKQALVSLMESFQKGREPILVVRSCFWANTIKDQILEDACRECNGIFVDISQLKKDRANYARSRGGHTGAVGNHPGDKGMQAIADAILKALPE